MPFPEGHEVDVPNLSIDLNRLPNLLEWCMVGCVSKDMHQNDMCRKEIVLRVQICLTII